MFGAISGAHFNPVVSLVDASFGGLRWREALAYIPAQVLGCIAGAVVANGMFALAAISISDKHRASEAHLLAEVVATLGLLLVARGRARAWLMVIPVIWCVISGLTLLAMKSPDAWILALAVALVAVLHMRRGTPVPRSLGV